MHNIRHTSFTKTCIAALLVSLAPSISTAATWVLVGGNDNVVVSIDTDSLRTSNSKTKYWSRWQYENQRNVDGAYPPVKYRKAVQLYVADCSDRVSAVQQNILYSDDSGTEVVKSYSIPEKSLVFDEVTPDTLGEALLNYACKNVKQAKKSR